MASLQAREMCAARWLIAMLGACLASACIAPGADVHLAPLFTRMATADGATELEALGGAYFERRRRIPAMLGRGTQEARALRPLWGWRKTGENSERTDFLVPLGYWKRTGGDVNSLLFPLYYWRSAPVDWRASQEADDQEDAEGQREFDLIALPGLFLSRNDRGAHKAGLFPIYGQLNEFATYDRLTWLLFPLYASVERNGEKFENLLWPFLGWTKKGYRNHWRVWPLFGINEDPGRFARHFALWPFISWSAEGLDGPDDRIKRHWMVWPLLGRTSRGSDRSTSFLWPFFGFASDPRGGEVRGGEPFWAWDGPWPLVRLQGGGQSPLADERTRVWPFYSFFEGDGLRWWTWAWPIVHKRRSETAAFRRAAFYVVPVWQSWDLYRPDGITPEKWRKLWPLYRRERRGDWRRNSFLALNPLGRNSTIDFYYGWLWELFAWETEGQRRKERAWLGLYRHESDAVESRSSLTGLWSRRTLRTETADVIETSLLFGLLRWRSGPESSSPGVMRPAFPGPGWPADWSPTDATYIDPLVEDSSELEFLVETLDEVQLAPTEVRP